MVELLGVVFVTLFVGLFVRAIRLLVTILSKKAPGTRRRIDDSRGRYVLPESPQDL